MELSNLDLEIFFIRHGEAIGKKNYWSRPDASLNEFGMEQVQKTAKLVKDIKFNKCYSSTLLRAIQTAKIINDNNRSFESFIHSDWLSEINLGVWAGKSKEECLKILPNSLRVFLSKNYYNRGSLIVQLLRFQKNFKFPEGETVFQFWNRVTSGFVRTLNSFRNLERQKIALVSHGGPLSIILLFLLEKNFNESNFPVFIIGLGDFLIVKITNNQIIFQHLFSYFNQDNT